MEAFSYHHQQQQSYNNNIIDQQTIFFPNPSTTTTTTTSFPPPLLQQPAAAANDHFYGHHHHNVSLANKLQITPESSMSMVVDDCGNNDQLLLAKKKNKDKLLSSNLNHAQSKNTSNKMKKPKKSNNDYQEEKRKKSNTTNKKGSSSSHDQEEDQEAYQGAVGYIHVRARRGQATDSHSLAERLRREKISERMKLLQAIVPGCDKVTGKTLMLDEIINYVQSLQNQVEFLSMKLASVNPILYDFGVDLDPFMLKPDENMSNMVLPIMPSVQQCSTNNGGAATFAPANNNNNNYHNHHLPQLNDAPSSVTNSLLFQHSLQMPNILSQGNGQQLWDVDEQRLKLDINSFTLNNNLTSFH